MVFDPHPDDSGLTTKEAYGVFLCLNPWQLSRPETDEEMRARFEANFTDKELLERFFPGRGGYKLSETRLRGSWFRDGATR